ncbi:hypothetical protein [Kitasatospora indigofera]|uniref:hypothetical protein n=1 Tax=Kitasatospora indigofera TaxID=67307 RepID=UPI0036922F1C
MPDHAQPEHEPLLPPEPRPTWAADCHRMLLGLAGRIPDADLVRVRTLLAEQQRRALATELAWVVLQQGLHLPEPEEDLLAELLEADGQDSSPLDGLPSGTGSEPSYAFSTSSSGAPDDEPLSSLDEAAGDALAGIAGARGLWRSWRSPTSGQAPPRRVFVVEMDRGQNLYTVTGLLQHYLEAAGEVEPQVEVYATGDRIPLYQQLARQYGQLLWTPAAPPFSVAPVFAESQPTSGFPRVDDLVEADQVVAYLQAGEMLLSSPELLEDLLAPARGAVVPVSIRTDGSWIWSEATTYYLEEYGMEPDAGLLAHIRAVDFVAPVVDGATRHRAIAFLTQSDGPDAYPLAEPDADSL